MKSRFTCAQILLSFGRSFLALTLLSLSACTKAPEAPPTEAAKLYAHGKAVYQGNCIACHNADPHLNGSIGPNLAGSSQELLAARLLRLEYPPGYTPKRKGGGMNSFPWLEKDIPALTAYLNNKK